MEIEDSKLDNQLFNIWTELKRLNSKLDALIESKTSPPIVNIPVIETHKAKPIIRNSAELIRLMETRSANSAIMAKEAPKPEEVK